MRSGNTDPQTLSCHPWRCPGQQDDSIPPIHWSGCALNVLVKRQIISRHPVHSEPFRRYPCALGQPPLKLFVFDERFDCARHGAHIARRNDQSINTIHDDLVRHR